MKLFGGKHESYIQLCGEKHDSYIIVSLAALEVSSNTFAFI